jgi:uncharacterized protein
MISWVQSSANSYRTAFTRNRYTMIIQCPRCGKTTATEKNRYRPFCSERCKLIDLDNWMAGTYRIPVATADEDEDGDSPPETAERE